MKKMITIIIALLVLLITLSFTKNIIAKISLSRGIKALTGLNLKVDSMDVGIAKTSIDIRGLKLFNPRGFPDKLMVDMPEVYVDYNLGAFIKGEVHLEEVRLHLKEFAVVRDKKGRLNLDSLKAVQSIKEKNRSRQKREMPGFRIDLLKLKINKAIYKDYSKSIQPVVVEYNINIDEEFENITNPYAFVSLIITRSLAKTPIERLADFDLGLLKKEATGIFRGTTKAAEKTAVKALKVGKDLEEKAKEALKKILPLGK